jgi:hypothetical protein
LAFPPSAQRLSDPDDAHEFKYSSETPSDERSAEESAFIASFQDECALTQPRNSPETLPLWGCADGASNGRESGRLTRRTGAGHGVATAPARSSGRIGVRRAPSSARSSPELQLPDNRTVRGVRDQGRMSRVWEPAPETPFNEERGCVAPSSVRTSARVPVEPAQWVSSRSFGRRRPATPNGTRRHDRGQRPPLKHSGPST